MGRPKCATPLVLGGPLVQLGAGSPSLPQMSRADALDEAVVPLPLLRVQLLVRTLRKGRLGGPHGAPLLSRLDDRPHGPLIELRVPCRVTVVLALSVH